MAANAAKREIAKRGAGKRAAVAEYVAARGGEAITEADWKILLERLAPVSEGYLRELLRSSGVPLAPLVEGVRQSSLEELERTLVALQQEYERATAAGNAPRARLCREAVIRAKDHARWAARKGAGKQEMIAWMLTWLENPPVFSAWVAMRKKQTASY